MVKIQQVRFIKQDSNGKPLNLVILDLSNGKPSIVRTAKAFLQDLDNSFLVLGATNINDPRVMGWLRDIRGASIQGDIKHHKAGETWTVQETSSIITDKNHPKFGSVAVGDTQTYEKDFTRVEGFLNIIPSEMVMARQANAMAIAQMTAQLTGVFDTPEAVTIDVTPDNAGEAFDPAMIPDEVVAQAQ